jgi:hypothetical protein
MVPLHPDVFSLCPITYVMIHQRISGLLTREHKANSSIKTLSLYVPIIPRIDGSAPALNNICTYVLLCCRSSILSLIAKVLQFIKPSKGLSINQCLFSTQCISQSPYGLPGNGNSLLPQPSEGTGLISINIFQFWKKVFDN